MIRLSRTVWIQLAVLAVVTVIAGGVMTFGFVKLPALLGIGRYTVRVEMPAAGGLYPTSVVTYRGTEVGRVRSVDVTPDGVRAVLTLNSDIPVPGPVTAAVHSRSAVGEQFLELTPAAGADPDHRLRDGDVIPAAAVTVPPDIAALLDATNRAITAIPPDNLRTVVDEAAKAVGGLGPELARIVDGSAALAIEAGKNIGPITALIDQSPAVLESQVRTSDSIAAWARQMAAITGQLRSQDAAFADLLRQGGPALREGTALFDRFSPTLPMLLTNMVSLGRIAIDYRADIEQLLVLFPQGTAVMSAIAAPNAGTKQDYRGIYLDFNLNLNLPPPCNTGFLPVAQQRSPSDVDAPERPAGELYCRLPQDSSLNVRGVRNIPCETNPGKRAPTVEMCESDQDYVPLNDGWNWKGDPNATLSGQDVPQNPPVAVPYDPATGGYVGPDGRPATRPDLVDPQTPGWQQMLTPPGG
ncbi:MAG: MCE family protein [Mycobacterium sp.]